MLREPFGKYKVAVCEYDTDYIEGKRRRKIPMMFYYPSDTGSRMCPYKDAAYQKEILSGDKTDNGVITYCYTDVTLSSEKDKYPVIIYSHGLSGRLDIEDGVYFSDTGKGNLKNKEEHYGCIYYYFHNTFGCFYFFNSQNGYTE